MSPPIGHDATSYRICCIHRPLDRGLIIALIARHMQRRRWNRFIPRVAILSLGITALSALYHYADRATSTTAAMSLLVLVMAAALVWGPPEAIFASARSVQCPARSLLRPVPWRGL